MNPKFWIEELTPKTPISERDKLDLFTPVKINDFSPYFKQKELATTRPKLKETEFPIF